MKTPSPAHKGGFVLCSVDQNSIVPPVSSNITRTIYCHYCGWNLSNTWNQLTCSHMSPQFLKHPLTAVVGWRPGRGLASGMTRYQPKAVFLTKLIRHIFL